MTGNRKEQEKPPYPVKEAHTQSISRAGFKARLGDWYEWLNIGLLFLVLEIAVLSIEQAKWITPQPSLTLVLILTMLSTWLLVKSRLPSVAIHVLVLVVGSLVTIWQATSVARLDEATIYFAVFLAFITWGIGYLSTWFILRRQNAWVAVSLGAVVILVNLSNLPDKYYAFFGFYFIAAILLIAQNRMLKLRYLLGRGTGYPKRGLLYFMASLLCIGILAVSVSWITPEIRVPQLETMIATKMLWTKDIEESRLNFFALVPAKQPIITSSTRRDLLFTEEWHQGSQVHFIVSSERPSYWRVHVYDTYTSQGWTNRPTSRYLLEKEVPWGEAETLSERDTLTYTVETNLKTDVLLTAGGFISSDTPVLVHVGAGDVIAVTAPRLLRPEERYTVTSSISSATRDNLQTAGKDYPQYIRENYLQLPPDFPESVRQLSESITRMANSPFAKVTVIDWYLSEIPYEEQVEAPPQGTDGVEHFLFTQKSGYCLHFASAMAVMLRSVGVPSRLVVGYLPGDEGDVGEYTLRDKHYHTWPQAYFPGYGWVDLEVTPSLDSEVTIETPWVASQIAWEGGQQDAWLSWYTLGMWQEFGGTEIGEAAEKIEFREPGWLFAEVIGKTLLWLFGGVILIMLLAVPVLALRSAFYRWLWGVVRKDCASTEYSKLCVLGSLVKLRPRPQQTPLEYAAELTLEFPRQAKALDNIVQAYVQRRFGRRGAKLGLMEEAELLKSRGDVYRILLTRLGFFNKLFYRR